LRVWQAVIPRQARNDTLLFYRSSTTPQPLINLPSSIFLKHLTIINQKYLAVTKKPSTFAVY